MAFASGGFFGSDLVSDIRFLSVHLASSFATAARSVLDSARRMSFCARVVIVPVSFVSLRRFRMVLNAFCCAGVSSVRVMGLPLSLIRYRFEFPLFRVPQGKGSAEEGTEHWGFVASMRGQRLHGGQQATTPPSGC